MKTFDFLETFAACVQKAGRCRQLHVTELMKIYLVQKETQCFHLYFWGLKIVDIKNCFNSVIMPSNKDLDCIVSSQIGYRALLRE